MKNKITFGLNFKILVGICLLLLICTAFNLIYSYKLFIDDKTSYIYETGLKKSESMNEQVQAYFTSIKSNSQTYSFLINLENFDFEKFINGEKYFFGAGTVIMSDDVSNFTMDRFIETEQSPGNLKSKEAEIIDHIKSKFPELKNESSFNSTEIVATLGSKEVLLNLYKGPASSTIFFSIIDIMAIRHFLENDKIFSNQLIFLDSPKELKKNPWLKDIDYKKIAKGTKEITIGDSLKLVSYAVALDGRYIIISSIDRENAFGITKFLIIKTILFACVLLGLAIAAGVYFSASITHPIKELTMKAERTASGDFSQVVQVTTTDEISVLGNTFNWMNQEIQQMIIALEDYSKNLEQKVEERTLELKKANEFMGAMVNSLDQGLFVFDQDLKVNEIYTKACENVFGVAFAGKNFTEIIGMHTPEQLADIGQWSTIIFSEMIPFESAVDLGPRTKITGKKYTDPDFKHVQIDYFPMKNEEEKIQGIVAVGTDKTLEIQAIEKKKENEKYVAMIIKILNNKIQFRNFCQEADKILEELPTVYNEATNEVRFDLAMMLFHTLNGGFGMYYIANLQSMASGFETGVTEARTSNIPHNEYYELLKVQIETLKSGFNKLKSELDDLLGLALNKVETSKEVSTMTITKIKHLTDMGLTAELTKVIYDELVKEPVINYFKSFDDVCIQAAKKTEKEFEQVEFLNPEFRLDVSGLTDFFNVLIHLFRNCIDHGIESPDKRLASGKSSHGSISVNFDLINRQGRDIFLLNVTDDGQGINSEIIRKKYMELHPEADLSSYTEKDIINLIFDPFFSTRDEVSSLSGRGVGMSAIKDLVDKLHGQIRIETVLGKGSSFTFLIPMS